jgi:hypothetical protein
MIVAMEGRPFDNVSLCQEGRGHVGGYASEKNYQTSEAGNDVKRYVTLVTVARFEFPVESSGNLHAAVSMAPEGVCFAAIDNVSNVWNFAKAAVGLFRRMRVGVINENGDLVRQLTTTFEESLTLVSQTFEPQGASVNVNAFDGVISRNLNFVVHPGFSVIVLGLQQLHVLATDNARCDVDFGSLSDANDPPGFGLNCPFASISIV